MLRGLLCVHYLLATLTVVSAFREEVDLVGGDRQWVMLAGLFPVRVNENEMCGKLRNSAVERIEAMIYAIQRVNQNPNLLPEVNLTFDIRDTCTIPVMALGNTLSFVLLDVDSVPSNQTSLLPSGVLGPAISDGSLLVANVLQLYQVPQISYGSTAAVLSDQTRYKYFFRTIPSDVQQVRAIAGLIREFNWTYVFVLHSADTYGTDGSRSLVNELNGRNGSVSCSAVQISLPLGSMENDNVFDRAVDEMSREWARNAAVAVLFGHDEEARGMLSAVERRVQLDPSSPLRNITWIASDSWGLSLAENLYSKARGMLAVQPVSYSVADFVEYFTSLTPNTTRNPWFNGYWESFFGCSLDTNSKNPCSLETQRLPSNLMLSLQHPYVISGVYAFAVALDRMLADYCPSKRLCDQVVVMRSNHRVVDGRKLRQYLLNVSLSDINFLQQNDSRLFDSFGDVQGSYMIYNLQGSEDSELSFRLVATWDHLRLLTVNKNAIEWRSGSDLPPQSVCSLPCGPGQEPIAIPDQAQCCWRCKDCLGEFTVSSGEGCYECNKTFLPNADRSSCDPIELTYFTWSSPLGIVITILASAGTVVCIFTGLAYIVFFNEKLIKASSRELSALLLCGILFCYILSFIFLIKPSPGTCAIQRIGSSLSFALVFSALLVKTNRIHRIFNRATHEMTSLPRFVSPISQVVITCLLVLVQMIIASIWLAAEPPRVTTVKASRKTLELVCDHSPHATLLVTVLYNLILLIGSTYFAFRTRKVPENYNEARFVNITLFTLCLIWLAFVPTYYISTVELGTIYQLFLLLLNILLSASATMCCLIMPKLILVVLQKVKVTDATQTQSGDISSNRKVSKNSTDYISNI